MIIIMGCIKKLRAGTNGLDVEWEIKDYLSCEKYGFYTYESDKFSYSYCNWNFQISYDSEKILYLDIKKGQSQSKMRVLFQCGIRLKDGNSEPICVFRKFFDESADVFGDQEFIALSELQERRHEMLPNGCLVITCSVLHSRGRGNNLQMKTNQNLDAWSLKFKELFVSKKNTDVVISVEEKEFPVHKAVLIAQSTVFAAMFEHDMAEKTSGTIKVADCDPISFEDFLLYLYSGKAENLTTCNVCHMYMLADKYNVQDLKSICVTFMTQNKSVENLLDFVVLAYHFSETKLMSAVQEVFNENTLKIISSDDWEPFQKENLSLSNQLIIRKLQS